MRVKNSRHSCSPGKSISLAFGALTSMLCVTPSGECLAGIWTRSADKAEPRENRCSLQVAPLNVSLVSDAVAQAEQVPAVAAKDTIAIIYQINNMTTTGLVVLIASVSTAPDGARIGHLGIVTHGDPGELDLSNANILSQATLPDHALALKLLRSVLSSDNPVGTEPDAGFVWEYRNRPVRASKELFSLRNIFGLYLFLAPNLVNLAYTSDPFVNSLNLVGKCTSYAYGRI